MNIRRLLLTFSTVLFAGCSGTFKHELKFNPSEPIRVAVLPFYEVDDDGKLVENDGSLLVDNVPLISGERTETPAVFVRKLVRTELGKTALDLVNQNLVDSELVHHGFAKEKDLSIDLQKVIDADPRELCTHMLYCDAVLYGKITSWDRSYYGIQSNSTVGLELKLVSAADKKVLFETRAEDSEGRGLTKGPTGFSDLVIEPVRGLDNEIINDLATSVVKKALEPLRVESRPEFLNSSPPSIYASAHDSLSGSISSDGHLTVVMVGSPGRTASFSIGKHVENLPMAEHEPGHYVGTYYPLSSDRFEKTAVYVQLTDQFGRTTRQKLGRGDVSLSN